MKRVMVTGVRGFTGRYVAQELRNHGWDVWGIGAQPVPGDPRYVQVDITDQEALQRVCGMIRPDAVIHLAAKAFVAQADAELFYQVNLLGTRHLLAALATCTPLPQHVILASSANVYAPIVAGSLDESAPTRPANEYAVSKLSMEHLANLWMETLPITVTRPFNYTGVGQSQAFLVPKLIDHYVRKAPCIELGNVNIWRDFSDVRSVAYAYRLLLETGQTHTTVNMCSGVAISLMDIVARLEDLTGHKARITSSATLSRKNEISYLCGNPEKLENLIGSWQSFSFVDTLRWMLREARG